VVLGSEATLSCPAMTRSSVEAVVRALNEAGVRYLIAGGLAVVAHGYVRFTADVDLILDLAPDNLARALQVFEKLGYRPRAPVALTMFQDPASRASWAREKGMTVFSLNSSAHPATELDLFVETPLEFDPAFARARKSTIAPGVEATFVGYDDLIALKRKAGRPQDREDIERLESLRREES